jgi:hypothetical protein
MTNTKKIYTLHNDILIKELKAFYQISKNANMLNKYLNNKKISLRLIDFFITYYCKVNNIILTLSNKKFFNIYSSYKQYLKAYSKILFDPFCRKHKIDFIINVNGNETTFETSIGQLNFFKWLIEQNILLYIEANIQLIEEELVKYNLEKINKKKGLKEKGLKEKGLKEKGLKEKGLKENTDLIIVNKRTHNIKFN